LPVDFLVFRVNRETATLYDAAVNARMWFGTIAAYESTSKATRDLVTRTRERPHAAAGVVVPELR
jgi:hypothetical protein